MARIEKRTDRARPYRVRYRDPQGRQRSRSFKRKVDAEAFAERNAVELRESSWVDPDLGKITLADWIVRHREQTVDLRPSTLARDESYTRNHILPRFGQTPIGQIRQPDVQAWVASLSRNGLAPATVVKAYQLLARALSAAVAAGRLKASPCRQVRLPKVELVEMMFLTPEQIATLAQTIDERYRALVLLGAYGGLRRSEMFGLRRRRLDVLRARASVSEILVEVGGRQLFGPPKTRAGVRQVPLPRPVAAALNDHLGAFVEPDPDALVFTAPMGGPMRGSLFARRFWAPAVARAGLDGLRLHDLRHTAVALWIASGADVKQIQRWAGHTSAAVVLDRYGHVLPDREDHVMRSLESLSDVAQMWPRSSPGGDVLDMAGR